MRIQWPWMDWRRNRNLLFAAQCILQKQKIPVDSKKEDFLHDVIESVECVLTKINFSEEGICSKRETSWAVVISNSARFLSEFEEAVQIAYTMTFIRKSGFLHFSKLFSLFDDRVFEEEERNRLMWPGLLVVRRMLIDSPVGQDKQNYVSFNKLITSRDMNTKTPLVMTILSNISAEDISQTFFARISEFYCNQTSMLIEQNSTIHLLKTIVKPNPIEARKIICQE